MRCAVFLTLILFTLSAHAEPRVFQSADACGAQIERLTHLTGSVTRLEERYLDSEVKIKPNSDLQSSSIPNSNAVMAIKGEGSTIIQPGGRSMPALDSALRVLVWNTYKFQIPGANELISENDSDLILLQESLVESHESLAKRLNMYAPFSPGYRSSAGQTGVATLSKFEPIIVCSWQHEEPWLRSPKATLVTLYRVDGIDLVAINLHSINFTLSTEAWRAQLASVSRLLESYEGRLILAGDFNTWSDERLELLNRFTHAHALSPVVPIPDQRTTVFGNTLDHLFVRGLKVDKSSTIVTESSDHNAVLATLILSDSNSL